MAGRGETDLIRHWGVTAKGRTFLRVDSWVAVALVSLAILLPGCATQPDHSGTTAYKGKAAYNRPYRVGSRTYYPMASARNYRERGRASWYGWESGDRTATGSRFDPRKLTAAHRTLPLPTRVRVTNLDNKRSVDVLVNDRGPFVNGRLIDLSQAAAKALEIRGTAHVEVSAID